jgi:uridylate kinase
MRIVVSLGGSTFIKKEVDVKFLKELKELMKRNENEFCVVAGGGGVARYYTTAGKKLGLTEPQKHELGRDATLINAKIVAYHLGAEYVYDSPFNVSQKWRKKTIVTGGYSLGWNTDVGAAMIAAITQSLLINVTNVEYVYDKDPKLKGAKPVKEMNWERMRKITGKKFEPGMKLPFHPEAVRICAKNKVKMLSMNAGNFKKYLRGEKWKGTTIS